MIFTCPCCGYEVFPAPPGSYDICPICFWGDDDLQLYYPHAHGANPSSLIESQVNFVQFGACDKEIAKSTRKVMEDDMRDGRWFPLWERRVDIPDINAIEPERGASVGDLYYWIRPSSGR
ncbi:CPCC family cysteine-rich protein [Herbaspirillum seropedicae]|uniref:CPCC family cysteine-rich protein n=1 Tax=Herbaspirillum seropedicae TaxID=964 RepID=UPI0035B5638A